LETAGPIVAVGLLVFLAHLFAALYEKTRIPDVVPLVFTGLLLGPVLKLVKIDQFGQVGSVFTTLALVIILFESGLAFRLDSLKKAWFLAGRISAATFVAIVAAISLVTMHIFAVPFSEAIIVGLLLAATSPMGVASIVSKLNVSEDLKTTLILESTVREVLSIVLTLACFNLAKHPELPTAMLGSVISSFVLASVMGIVAAILWASLLPTMRYVRNSIFCTPAFVCIVFGFAELLGYSGPLASLAFGTVLGNIDQIKVPKIPLIPGVRASLTPTEIGFFSAIGFLMKTLFFVYLGISMSFRDPQVIYLSLVITVWIFLSRLLIVKFGVANVLSPREAAVTSFMMPKGLAAAVLASMLVETGMANADVLRQVAYGVILLTITITSLMMFLIEKGYLDKVIIYIFPDHRKLPLRDQTALEAGAVDANPKSISVTISGEGGAGMSDGTKSGAHGANVSSADAEQTLSKTVSGPAAEKVVGTPATNSAAGTPVGNSGAAALDDTMVSNSGAAAVAGTPVSGEMLPVDENARKRDQGDLDPTLI
jgi:potassium/hydrogen antiporter